MAEALDTTLDQADIESNWTETVESFDALELNEDLLRGIYAYGFEKPSAIQQKGILPLIRGRDSICQAQSGTGKTATFAIGVLQRIDLKTRTCQALLLAPTRELAQQIQKVVIQLGDFMQAQCHACIGGTNVRDDIRKLQEGVHIVVGTPGRVYVPPQLPTLQNCNTCAQVRHDRPPRAARQRHQDVRAGRGGRDAVEGLQGPDL